MLHYVICFFSCRFLALTVIAVVFVINGLSAQIATEDLESVRDVFSESHNGSFNSINNWAKDPLSNNSDISNCTCTVDGDDFHAPAIRHLDFRANVGPDDKDGSWYDNISLTKATPPPDAPTPGGSYCGPATIPTTCTYTSSSIPSDVGFGEVLCINEDYNHGLTLTIKTGGTLYIANGANFDVNGTVAVENGAKVIMVDCSSLSVFGSLSFASESVIEAYCPAQTSLEIVNNLNVGIGVPTCNQANTYCPISSYFGANITNADIHIAPCATNIATTGDVTECSENPMQTLLALATPPAGASVVWYDAASGGNVVGFPTWSDLGSVTYYAESVDGTSGMPSLVRTPITLTITPKPSMPTVAGPVPYCVGDTASALTATGSNLLWYTAPTGGTGTSTAPTPSTVSSGSTSYYVSQVNANGCESLRAEIVVNVEDISINTQPSDRVAFTGSTPIFALSATPSPLIYQWQVSTDGGSVFNNVIDGTEYANTQTANLSVINVELGKNGYRYRVLINSPSYSCNAVSSSALLTTKVRTIITNRNITNKVKKN